MPCLGWAGVLAAHRRLYWAAYPTGGSMLPPTPFGGWGGPKKLTCSRSVRLGCWVGLGANTPCTLWYGGVGIVSVIHRSTESHRWACALGVASESVCVWGRPSRAASVPASTSALEAFEDTSELLLSRLHSSNRSAHPVGPISQKRRARN